MWRTAQQCVSSSQSSHSCLFCVAVSFFCQVFSHREPEFALTALTFPFSFVPRILQVTDRPKSCEVKQEPKPIQSFTFVLQDVSESSTCPHANWTGKCHIFLWRRHAREGEDHGGPTCKISRKGDPKTQSCHFAVDRRPSSKPWVRQVGGRSRKTLHM